MQQLSVAVVVIASALVTLITSAFAGLAAQNSPPPFAGGDNVILITLDGVRTEEMFGGLDIEVLKSTLAAGQRVEETASYRRFWAPTREERRRRLCHSSGTSLQSTARSPATR